jgi:exonuclease SbcD
MKIGITADVHLANRKDHPERYNALTDILNKLTQKKINVLIIAGDLFDASYDNYSEFDKILSQYKDISIHVIPGNHDPTIDNTMFTSKNLEIYLEPTLKGIDDSKYKFLFLPYQKETVMGESIALHKDDLEPNKWVLIGHGDWESRMKMPNPLEPGVYMPLSQKDINLYKPAFVFLGHIHKPIDEESMSYLGSPCGLDITEAGKRRFIIFDTKNIGVESHPVETDIIYFDETFLILPLKNEDVYVREQIQKRIKRWNITDTEKAKTEVRIKLRGYSTDIRKLNEVVNDEFKDYALYGEDGIDVSEVFISRNLDLEEISRKVIDSVNEIEWETGSYKPSREDILFHALKTVYGDA